MNELPKWMDVEKWVLAGWGTLGNPAKLIQVENWRTRARAGDPTPEEMVSQHEQRLALWVTPPPPVLPLTFWQRFALAVRYGWVYR